MGLPVQAPGEHIECHKEVSGWFNDLITLPDALRVPESLAKYLFDDSPGNLGISMTDFYMGRNGWGMENDQSHSSAG